jgi:hypothetical protein
VQAFLPSPMATATAMYHSERNPLGKISRRISDRSRPVFTAKKKKQRDLHKAFLRYHDPKNWPLLRDALKQLGRSDLIGNHPNALIPDAREKGAGTHTNRPHKTTNRRVKRLRSRRKPR